MKDLGTIYVLGAGASIGANRYPKLNILSYDKRMPSGENFFYDLFHDDKRSNGIDFINLFGATYEGINRLILQTYKMDESESFYNGELWRGLNIENLLTHIDIGTKMYPKGSNYYKTFKFAKEEILRFISIMLMMRSLGQRCLFLVLRPLDF